MQRIKIQLPETFPFSTDVRIRITDINYGGHLGNDSFLALIHEARQRFLKNYGYEELRFAGYGLIMADAALEFKRELNYGDVLTISVAASGFHKYGFDLYYKLEVLNSDQPQITGKAKTGMLCYDYENRKLTAMPVEAILKLSNQ